RLGGEHARGLAGRARRPLLQAGGDRPPWAQCRPGFGLRGAGPLGVGRDHRGRGHLCHGPGGDAGADPDAAECLGHGYPSLSRSLATRAASSSRAWSAPSPSATSTTSSPPRASRANTDRMLRASTGSPPAALAMVTFTGCLAAAWTNMAAGRACRPTLEPITTRRSGMKNLRLRHAGTSPAISVPDSINAEGSRRLVRPHSPAFAGVLLWPPADWTSPLPGGRVRSRMRIEIAEQPEALSNTFDALLAQVGELAALGRDTRQVLFIARGSSDNAPG